MTARRGAALLGILMPGDVVITPKIDLGGDTTGNGMSKLIFTILSAVAVAERDRTRERIAEVKRDQRQRGRYLGGTPPFGWRVGKAGELIAVPEQQAAINRMRRLKDQDLALRAIADRMTAAGVQISHVGVKMPSPRIAKRDVLLISAAPSAAERSACWRSWHQAPLQ